ncbi:MAG: tetratricopeptide repeat protein [Candidatus Polarisedimenticolaceae bacterium]|nr:tetratricopeptide repeat protein [Candidatus Polarisedimenticolaceae bacterium]
MKKQSAGVLVVLLWGMSIGLFVAVLWGISGITAVAHSAEKKSLSQQTYKVLMAAQELQGTGDFGKAISNLKELLAGLESRPYEQAIVLQGLSHAYISQEDYRAAIPSLKQSIALGALPDEPQQRARYNLIRLYMATEGFAEAISQLDIWFSQVETPQPEAYVILATAHLQLGDYQAAIEPLRTAIKISEAPREGWYQSLLGAYNELEQYDNCEALLHTMLQHFPDRPNYWRQLVGIQLTQDKYRDALATMELAYLRGHIHTEKEMLNLAQLYLHLNAPYKAAALIEREIKQGHIDKSEENWEHAANAWLLARETDKAIAALESAKATLRNPQLGLQLARLYIESRRWVEADSTLNAVIDTGKLAATDAGQAWMLLGIVRHEAKSTEAARMAFIQAGKYRKTASSAKQWLAFLDQT